MNVVMSSWGSDTSVDMPLPRIYTMAHISIIGGLQETWIGKLMARFFRLSQAEEMERRRSTSR